MKKKNLPIFIISVIVAVLGIVIAVFFYDAKRRKEAVKTLKDLFKTGENNLNKAVNKVKKSVKTKNKKK